MAFRETALGMHNNFRSLVATGRARNGFYWNENAPPAALMYLLRWDCWAEAYAHAHVRSCSGRPSYSWQRPGWKENIHVLRTTATDRLGAIQNAIATWRAELALYGVPSNMVFAYWMQNWVANHMTKIVWGNNKHIGCATQRCNGFYFTSCLYRNQVNTVGTSIYPIGAVCSQCPAGPHNCNGNVGLCSW